MPGPKDFRFHVEPLGRQHDRAAFCCGVEPLDRYLKSQASQDARKNVAAPFVLLEGDARAVKGYYTLSMTGIELGALPDAVAQKMPRYPLVPAILLGRLAVDQRCRGLGLGQFLLMDALQRGLKSEIAWFALFVEALDEPARAFYTHYGFIPLLDRPRSLFLPQKTIAQAFA